MGTTPLASIIIANYNYAAYLPAAIDSALDQTYPKTEVIVVDDGSTDNSRAIVKEYGPGVRHVFKENGGQLSACNAGFSISKGDVVCFLDADDLLLPTCIEQAVARFADAGVIKVHWPLYVIDRLGRRTGKIVPPGNLPEGDLLDLVVRDGPASYVTPQASGNAWRRAFLEQVFPLPEHEQRMGHDGYLHTLAPLFGKLAAVSEPQSCYRVHGRGHFSSRTLISQAALLAERFEYRSEVLARYLRERGYKVGVETWKQRSHHYRWMTGLVAARRDLEVLLPPGATCLLVDEDQWGGQEIAAGRRFIPFPERDGCYWGPPADSFEAIREVEAKRQAGADFIVFWWPAFWWLTFYAELHQHLLATSRRALANDRLVVFDLRDTASDSN